MLEIVAFLKMLPALIKFCIEAQKYLQNAFGDNPEKRLIELTDAISKLRQSSTTEDRVDAIEKIEKQLRSVR